MATFSLNTTSVQRYKDTYILVHLSLSLSLFSFFARLSCSVVDTGFYAAKKSEPLLSLLRERILIASSAQQVLSLSLSLSLPLSFAPLSERPPVWTRQDSRFCPDGHLHIHFRLGRTSTKFRFQDFISIIKCDDSSWNLGSWNLGPNHIIQSGSVRKTQTHVPKEGNQRCLIFFGGEDPVWGVYQVPIGTIEIPCSKLPPLSYRYLCPHPIPVAVAVLNSAKMQVALVNQS